MIVDVSFVRKCSRAAAKREGDLPLPVHRRRWICGQRLRCRIVRRHELECEQDNTRRDDHSMATHRAYQKRDHDLLHALRCGSIQIDRQFGVFPP